jgi:hypothetical protein
MIQQVFLSLLYYGQAVYPTILTITSALTSQQATATNQIKSNQIKHHLF